MSIDKIKEMYEVESDDFLRYGGIETFLETNANLCDVLMEASEEIYKVFPKEKVKTLRLKKTPYPDGGESPLYLDIIVRGDVSVEEAVRLLNETDNNWYSKLSAQVRCAFITTLTVLPDERYKQLALF